MVSSSRFLQASAKLLADVERKNLTNISEAKRSEKSLRKLVRLRLRDSANSLETTNLAGRRVVAPGSRNLRQAMLGASQTASIMMAFGRSFLSRYEVGDNVKDFPQFTYSRFVQRLVQPIEKFLEETEQDPISDSMFNEAKVLWIDDATSGFSKLEQATRSRSFENFHRGIVSRLPKSNFVKIANNWDFNSNNFRLTLNGPVVGTVRSLLSSCADVDNCSFLVGAGPNTVSTLTSGRRTSELIWRVMTAKELDEFFSRSSRSNRLSFSSWRGLGLGPNSTEFYIPIPGDILEEVTQAMRDRRSEFLSRR